MSLSSALLVSPASPSSRYYFQTSSSPVSDHYGHAFEVYVRARFLDLHHIFRREQVHMPARQISMDLHQSFRSTTIRVTIKHHKHQAGCGMQDLRMKIVWSSLPAHPRELLKSTARAQFDWKTVTRYKSPVALFEVMLSWEFGMDGGNLVHHSSLFIIYGFFFLEILLGCYELVQVFLVVHCHD